VAHQPVARRIALGISHPVKGRATLMPRWTGAPRSASSC
jgi:hypothetical protein